MKLSILDYGLLDEQSSPSQAYQETVALAQKAEKLGYHRFWLAEHHNVHALTISSPELLMLHLLHQTESIRIGSGGIMVLHYSSLKVAETIKTLTTLFPNRVDIGIGNSLGTSEVNHAMRSVYTSNDYEKVLKEISAYLSDLDREVFASPVNAPVPPFWLLSMGETSASLAGRLGLGYTYGVFPYIVQDPSQLGQKVAEIYRQSFIPKTVGDKPNMMLAVFVAVAETSHEAEKLATSLDVWLLGNQSFNEYKTFPSLKTAQACSFTEEEKQRVLDNRTRLLVGTIEEVSDQLKPWVSACQPDELLLIPLVAGFANRLKSLELLTQLKTLLKEKK